MKINICYGFVDTPSGGGNQFLKTLKNEFTKRNVYTSDYNNTDILLYNGHQHAEQVYQLRSCKLFKMKFVHRLDGLQKLYNGPNDIRQDIAFRANEYAHGSIFQSNWIVERFKDFNYPFVHPFRVIGNAVDPNIFNCEHNNMSSKKLIVTTNWSPNPKKGFKYYQYLDDHLDFEKYDYFFIGNMAPGYTFKNIKWLSPMSTDKIAKMLSMCDLFISGAENECLSNSIIEALSSNVPVLALNSGSNPELINNSNGMLFNTENELIGKIDQMLSTEYNIVMPTISEIADQYIEFFKTLLEISND